MLNPPDKLTKKQLLQGSFVKLNELCGFNAGNGVSFRLYPDNRPKNLEIAPLQKGLVLLISGFEVIEEGAGFGVPIVKYEDCTYFSSTAELFQTSQGDSVFKKVYNLDVVSKKQIQGAFINDDLYSLFHKTFERAYLNRQELRPVFDWIMRLRKALGVETQFVKAESKGKVAVTYHCFPDKIGVNVDLSDMDTCRCQEVLLLNEQGATRFRRCYDSDGIVLYDGQISAWAKVKAKQIAFSDANNRLAFSLENLQGATLYCGREQIKDRFSWSGMTYALNPNVPNFSYAIHVSH